MRERTSSILRTALACVLVLAAGFTVAHAVTDGFRAFTRESARRLNALQAPAPVPDLALEFADGRRGRLADLDAPVLLADFVYTSCPTLCAVLGSVYARLEDRLAAEIAGGTVRLVSISFDPARDDPAALRAYRDRHAPTADGWELGRPVLAGEREEWLRRFGVVVIPDGLGGYAHNAAVHVIGPDRRLAAIHGLDDVEGIVATARALAARETRHAAR